MHLRSGNRPEVRQGRFNRFCDFLGHHSSMGTIPAFLRYPPVGRVNAKQKDFQDMPDVVKGFTAGFIATLSVTSVMMIKTQLGLASGLEVIGLLAKVADAPGQLLYGWLAHFAVGALVWGGVFGLASDRFPVSCIINGIGLGAIVWFIMMLVFFPVAGHSVFGIKLGPMVPVVSLGIHLVFGLVLGAVYQALQRPEPATAKYNR